MEYVYAMHGLLTYGGGLCMPYVWTMHKACAWMMWRDLCFLCTVHEVDLDSQWIVQHLYPTLMHGLCNSAHRSCIAVRILHGLCVDYAWIANRLCYAVAHGLCMSYVWITPGFCMDYVCSFQNVLISEALQYADGTRMTRGWVA